MSSHLIILFKFTPILNFQRGHTIQDYESIQDYEISPHSNSQMAFIDAPRKSIRMRIFWKAIIKIFNKHDKHIDKSFRGGNFELDVFVFLIKRGFDVKCDVSQGVEG